MLSTFLLLTSTLIAASTAPAIEVYTMGPGEHLFERYGHAAICVEEPAVPAKALCYNYGTTDFDAPAHVMGWGFLRGTSKFWVSISLRRSMLRAYVRSDRTIWRQRLALEPAQAARLAALLAEDAKEENRYYVYHHLRDNCSTRVRDMVDRATDNALSRDTKPIGLTYREVARRGLADQTWALMSSDFLLGRAADRELTQYDAMFLPRFLRPGLEDRLEVAPEMLFERKGPPFSRDVQSGRGWIVLAAVLLAMPGTVSRVLRRSIRPASVVTGVILTLIAAVIWGVAIISTVPELQYNEALLVFVPTDLLLVFFKGQRLRRYAQARLAGLILVALLLLLGVFVQPLLVPMAVALIPMVSIALSRPSEERQPHGR